MNNNTQNPKVARAGKDFAKNPSQRRAPEEAGTPLRPTAQRLTAVGMGRSALPLASDFFFGRGRKKKNWPALSNFGRHARLHL
jgi:hypothetical protein